MSDEEEEWTAADEWASWMFPGQYLPRFEDVPKVGSPASRRPLHERIQDLINCLNPETAAPRGLWMFDLRFRTPGDAGDGWGCRITNFELTVDNDLETEDDLMDAARMFLAGQDPSLKTDAIDEATRRAAERDQADWEEVDWEEPAEELKRHGPDWPPDVIHVPPSVFPGDARNLAEAEALVGIHPKHETLEEMPGACIMCGKDELGVIVQRNPDGEIEETRLKCHECGWRVTGGPAQFDERSRLDHPDDEVDWTS